MKSNKITTDLIIDTTVIRIFKLNKRKKELQEGYKQLDVFSRWIIEKFKEMEKKGKIKKAEGLFC